MYLTEWGALILLFIAILVIWLMIIFQAKSYEVEQWGQSTESDNSHNGDEHTNPIESDS